MKLRRFDFGYALALVIGRDPVTARVFVLRLPSPLSWSSLNYLWKRCYAE